MTVQCVATSRYMHLLFGAVHVKVHGTTRRISARWEGQELLVVVPRNMPTHVYDDFLLHNQDRILASKPQPRIAMDTIIDAPEADFTFVYGTVRPGTDMVLHEEVDSPERGKKMNTTLTVAERLRQRGPQDPYVQTFLNRCLELAARRATRRLVLPRAAELARIHGCDVAAWDVKKTKTSLGSCSSRRIITLSPKLIFLPDELRDFVIRHELAHLSHMDHSAAFHRLCDKYCGGQEARLSAATKTFRTPLV